jgi:hypothetical protein
MDVIVSTEGVDFQECEILVTGFFSDERPLRGSTGWVDWRFNGRISSYLMQERLTGDWRETTLIPSQGRVGAMTVLLMGLGKQKEYSYPRLRELCPYLFQTLRKLSAGSVCLSFPGEEDYNVNCGKVAEVLLEGITDSAGFDASPGGEKWIRDLRLFFMEREDRLRELLLGVQTAKTILEGRVEIRILAPFEKGHPERGDPEE